MKNIPLVLAILDGWGLRDDPTANAIAMANLPNYREMWRTYPTTSLRCSGEDVGLPHGQMGNSEVGHLNIGAGRIVYQELTRINRAIKDGSFFRNSELVKAMEHVQAKGTRLHLMGLVSDGGVHSHLDHLYALLFMAKQAGIGQVFIHAFLDGRDVSPTSGLGYVKALEEKCREIGVGKIATVMGRYYAMDRDKRWERVERAYRAMVLGEGRKATLAQMAVEQSYEAGITDEFVEPAVIVDGEGKPLVTIEQDDAIICFNFRADRARQITRAFVDEDFAWFDRPKGFMPVYYLCMTEYDITIKAPVAFGPQNLDNTLGQVLSKAGLRQLRIAETEKYAHVTFFFNGGVEAPNEGEDRILIPSPKVATYNLKPEMSAVEVTDRLLEELAKDLYQVVILNYANPDMVGHTGVLEAAVKAVETVDLCLGRVRQAVQAKGGAMIVTADHGNAEMMVDGENGGPHTAHTSSLVPFILVADDYRDVKLREGSLQDIAPTMLELIGLPKPAEMTGQSLIIK
ncbi:MAG TPA: 2,3-bisphosphoglycerate-independent phosphoglycerate mutase [Clostridia bacterium]|nr:2,3-bisphosphoglycerate-independent phosphoglycerate mutase [Clostridia bacterium]